MTLASVRSGALLGIEGIAVAVEVDIGSGLPAFNIVGLPDASVQEARERVRAAIRNAGFDFPLRRITVNLAPADVRKEGPIYDLPIAVAILVASGQIEDRFADVALFGELSLDGHLRHVKGVLPLIAMCARAGVTTAAVPSDDVAEARLSGDVRIHPLDALSRVREEPAGWPDPPASPVVECVPSVATHDLQTVHGQEHVKRAIEVAAAGGHNIMLQGPPAPGRRCWRARWPVCSRRSPRPRR